MRASRFGRVHGIAALEPFVLHLPDDPDIRIRISTIASGWSDWSGREPSSYKQSCVRLTGRTLTRPRHPCRPCHLERPEFGLQERDSLGLQVRSCTPQLGF